MFSIPYNIDRKRAKREKNRDFSRRKERHRRRGGDIGGGGGEEEASKRMNGRCDEQWSEWLVLFTSG